MEIFFSIETTVIKRFDKERNEFKNAENYEYKKRDSINSVQSSLKSHPL